MSDLTLGQRQELLMRLLPRLLDKAYSLGYTVRGGELQRMPAQAAANAASGAGIANSLHLQKLAIDIMLFKDGVYLTDTADYAALGAYWKTLDPLCKWGGDFSTRKDGNHFSIAFEGRA